MCASCVEVLESGHPCVDDDWHVSEQGRVAVANAARDIGQLNLETGTSGNLSARLGDLVVITGSGRSFADSAVTEHLAVVRTLDGARVGGAAPSSDVLSHLGLYAARSDIGAIVHTHSHYVTLASVLREPIPVITTMHADYFGSEIPVVPYANHRRGSFGDAQKFDPGHAFLLQGHGGLILMRHGELHRAAQALMALEEVARLYFEARLVKLRSELKPIPEPDVHLLFSYFSRQYGQS